MTSNRDRAAEILAQDRCWIPGPGGMERFSVAEGADALDAEGLLKEDLPAPDIDNTLTTAWVVPGVSIVWDADDSEAWASIDADLPSHIVVRREGDPLLIIPEDRAVEFAHKILAAHAQKEENNE